MLLKALSTPAELGTSDINFTDKLQIDSSILPNIICLFMNPIGFDRPQVSYSFSILSPPSPMKSKKSETAFGYSAFIHSPACFSSDFVMVLPKYSGWRIFAAKKMQVQQQHILFRIFLATHDHRIPFLETF